MCNYRMAGTAHDAGRYCKCGGVMALTALTALVEKMRYMVGVDFSHHAEQAAQRASAAMGVPAEMLGVLSEPQRPTYRVPAREVVPGMLLAGRRIASLVAAPQRTWPTAMRLTTDPGGSGLCEAGEEIDIQLAGPSPRELACACWEDALQHDDEYRWEDEVILQRGAECAEYAQRRAELATDHPGDHAPDCPVAPVQGRHGGMRLWPAPWRGKAWVMDGTEAWISPHGSEGYSACVWADELCIVGTWDGGRSDMVLQCFYRPPEPQPERREAPAWDPYGTDLDLAVRYG
jgi:hypothetical protein